jgi:hypothetical protein
MALARERELIRGPIFGWPYPILNAILELIARFRERRLARLSKLFPPEKRVAPAATYSNIETWELVEDAEGNLKKIIIHREAKRV